MIEVDPGNAGQAEYWDGAAGAFWAERAERFDEAVSAHQVRLLDAAAVGLAESVLDVGCGTGRTSRDVARLAASGSVLGVDLSARMIALARELAEREQLRNVTFRQADAQREPFPESHFDLVISRHGMMFFADSVAAFGNLARALRPGGRLVTLSWKRNDWMIAFRAAVLGAVEPQRPATPGSLRAPDLTRELLVSSGFDQVEITEVRAPMYFGPDADDATAFIAGQLADLSNGLDSDQRAGARDRLRCEMVAHEGASGVVYDSVCWLVQARRP